MDKNSKLSDLIPDANNANQGTERGRYMLERSMEKLGAGRSILLDKNGRIIAGNKTAEVAGAIGLEDVIIVQTDGRKLVAVQRTDLDLDSPAGREMAYADNRVGEIDLSFDPGIIAADIAAGIDLTDWWHAGELAEFSADFGPAGNGDGVGNLDLFDDLPLPEGVPDTLWPTDNEWGIPLLNIERQADAFDLPIETWGAKARGTKAGTLHFYTEDSRFNSIWERPLYPLKAEPVNMVEPNFSVYDQVPRVVALWQTYKKRWLARLWQSMGVRIFVDLNVARPYDDINLLGVPRGWRSYATRGYTSRLQALDEEHEIARVHGESRDVLFMVYGGGKAVKEWAETNGAVWVAEDMDRAKGKYLDQLGSEVKDGKG